LRPDVISGYRTAKIDEHTGLTAIDKPKANTMRKCALTSLSVLLCLSALLSGSALADTSAASGTNHSAARERIQRIENGLLPAIMVKGQDARGMNLQERMTHYKVPGVSIAFFSGGKILWSRAYGYANVAKMTPVTPETLFQAASISKPISTLAMLRLVQDGKLNLDEDVNVKLKSWKVPDNEFTKDQKITLRRIVSHSAGLTVSGFAGYFPSEPLPTITQTLDGQQPANSKAVRVDTVPGSKWRYSGGGFTVMQLLLTDVTGKPFPDIIDEEVLRPIGMSHSAFVQPLPRSLKRSAATAYGSDGKPITGDFHTYPELAAAGLWTTPSDLARAAIEIQNDYAGTSTKLLSKDMAHQMLTHQKDDWGLGVALSAADHPLRFGHGGSNEGFRCDLQAYIGSGQGIAIMTNGDGGGPLIEELKRAVAQEYGWPDFKPEQKATVPIDPATLSAYAGSYLLAIPDATEPKVHLAVREGRLLFQADPLGPEPVELFAESETQFFAAQGFGVTLHKNESGVVTKLTVHFGQDIEATKIP
jgi:CubicO group peptidase (beta-lactamase class C family)